MGEPGASLAPGDLAELEALARRGRLHVIETVSHSGAGHVGGPLSAMDMLVALYWRVLDIRPDEPRWPGRDRFVLSKGHSSVALYTVLAMRGYFPEDELLTFDKGDSRLQGHPDMLLTPGVDASTGSLGQGISIAMGIAMGLRRRGNPAHTFVMLGDGEIQEGQVWETVHQAPRYGLGNLTAIVDWNGMQQHGWALPAGETNRGNRRDPWAGTNLRGVFESFGWRVLEVDGHDLGQVIAACEDARSTGTGPTPTVILAHTVKGRGISFTEGRSEWHARPATPDEAAAARAELADVPAAPAAEAMS
ncbi:MAG: transketolase [Chloroflexota bacterium]